MDQRPKTKDLFFAACFFVLLLVFGLQSSVFGQSTKIVENFGRYKPGQFPTYFKTWPFQRGDAKKVYRVKEENGKKYLAAFDDKDLSEQIFREFDWNLDPFPYFKCKWRAKTLPKGAAEKNGATNDSACGVYIIFGK
ncbi:MAG: DUF3047 domain-containing protein, partial [bacterium]|nr:DUF3047 domain-containing protein [bacterium]